MKKISISILILLICQLSVSAQFNKGKLYIDGSMSIGNYQIHTDNNSISNKSSGFNFSPNIGLFVIDKLAVGLGFGYQNYYYSNTSDFYTSTTPEGVEYTVTKTSTNKFNDISPTLFVKYFYPFNEKLSLSLKASYAHGWGNSNIEDKATDSSTNIETVLYTDKPKDQSNYFKISPELQYMITPKFGMQLNFNGFRYESTAKYQSQFYTYLGVDYSTAIKMNQKTSLLDFDPKMWSLGVFFCL
jgi:hypothetical protein